MPKTPESQIRRSTTDDNPAPTKRQCSSSHSKSTKEFAVAMQFYEKEKERRRTCYRRQCERKKMEAVETIADRCKRASSSKQIRQPVKPTTLSPEDLYSNEITRIVQFDIPGRDIEWKKNSLG